MSPCGVAVQKPLALTVVQPPDTYIYPAHIVTKLPPDVVLAVVKVLVVCQELIVPGLVILAKATVFTVEPATVPPTT